MVSGEVEVERTYEVPSARAVLPALDDVPGVASVQRLPDEDLSATYYDTADLRLAQASATLRRRTGGRDAPAAKELPPRRRCRHRGGAGRAAHEVRGSAKRARYAGEAVTRDALVELAEGAGDEYAEAWAALTRKKLVAWLG